MSRASKWSYEQDLILCKKYADSPMSELVKLTGFNKRSIWHRATTLGLKRNILPDYWSLTEKEKEVIRYVCQYLSLEQISKALVISRATVNTHIANIYSKIVPPEVTEKRVYIVLWGLAHLNIRNSLEIGE